MTRLAAAAITRASLAIGLSAVGRLGGTPTPVPPGDKASVTFERGATAVTLGAFGDGGSHVLVYAHGRSVRFSFPFENRGHVPVRVTRVRLGSHPRSMLQVEQAGVGPGRLPSTLRPGHTATIVVSARYDNCRYYHEREIESVPAATVDVESLGAVVTRRLAFDHPLIIHSPMIVDCPNRTLDREDDVRRGRRTAGYRANRLTST